MSATQKLGKYEIQAQLAKGARAAVFRALDPETKRQVAIKAIPKPAVNSQALPAFLKQSQALAQLAHPGIARFVEALDTPQALCVVTELAEGQPLSLLLRDGAHPEGKIAWEVIRQLLEALAVAHVGGAVHRDIKPANVLLAPNGRATLLDFGTAMLYAATGDQVQHFAPEHFGEGKINARSDIYQMGILVYQLVTGKLPFTGSPEEVAHRVMQERPTDPSSFNNQLAWQLDWVIQKALSKEPSDRFPSALEFGDGLRLGLQDTLGRPLDPVKITPNKPSAPAAAPAAPAPAAAAAPAAKAAPNVMQNAKMLAEKANMAKALASDATQAPPAAKPAGAAPAARPAAVPPPGTIDPKKPTLLFIDDDERLLNGLRTLFRQEYNTITVASGAAALEVLKRGPVHVVVSDQRMPEMTGVELLRKVRELAPNAVRILLTGYTDLASLVGSINQGEIFRFVKKPWDNEELRKAIGDAAKIALELASTPAPKAESPRTAGSLLVIDPTQGLARGLERLLAGSAGVKLAATPQEAAKVLAKEEIACIVADMGAGMDGLVALFRELKAKRPEILSILLTDEPDSELAIDLINKAQIFRFLPKPVNGKELRTQVAAALRRYAAFKQIPTLGGEAPGKGAPAASAAAQRARALPG